MLRRIIQLPVPQKKTRGLERKIEHNLQKHSLIPQKKKKKKREKKKKKKTSSLSTDLI